MAQTTTPEQADVLTKEEFVRRGDALPIRDGAPWSDAPQVVLGPGCHEATAIFLAAQDGSPESRLMSHVGGHHFGGVIELDGAVATASGTWPRTHAALDQIAADNNVALPASATTIGAKIEELMGGQAADELSGPSGDPNAAALSAQESACFLLR